MLTVQRIANDEARQLVERAVAHSKQIGVSMCIAVVDESGYLVAFDRMNGAKVTSVSIAIDKAFTAAGARNPTSFYGRVSQPQEVSWGINQTNGGHFCVIAGGLPVLVDGVVIGGIGISGGTANQDEAVAHAALSAFSVSVSA